LARAGSYLRFTFTSADPPHSPIPWYLARGHCWHPTIHRSLFLQIYVLYLYQQWRRISLASHLSTVSRASCSPMSAFQSAPHSYAPLATRARRISDRDGQVCEVSRRAEACTISCVASHWSGSPFAFSSMPHLCVALATRQRRVPEHNGHLYEALRSAEACATDCDPSHLPEFETQLPGSTAQ